jgi:hypothetical protein
MQATRQTRIRERASSEVTVRVRCDRCGRGLGELYGLPDVPVSFSAGKVQGLLPGGSRIDYFRHRPGSRCLPAPYIVRWEKLVAAYRKAASRPPGRQRVIWLLADVRG